MKGGLPHRPWPLRRIQITVFFGPSIGLVGRGDCLRRCDTVFQRAKVACFVDGCFWHSCPIHGSVPKSNRDWWIEKLATNVARDRDTDERLAKAGWLVIRIWEHEEPSPAADLVERAVRDRRVSK